MSPMKSGKGMTLMTGAIFVQMPLCLYMYREIESKCQMNEREKAFFPNEDFLGKLLLSFFSFSN